MRGSNKYNNAPPHYIFNPNAPPFHPRQSQHQNVFPYATAPPLCDGYFPQVPFEYRGFDIPRGPLFMPEMQTNEFVPGPDMLCDQMSKITEMATGQQFTLSPELFQKMMFSPNATLLQEVQVGLEQLICQPNEFETWSSAIRDRLIDSSITPDALSIVAQIILQMATVTPSVQYNFARLCSFLSQEVDDYRQKYLLPVMREYHEKQRSLLTAEQQQNLLLFFAEVYEKLETTNGARLDVLGVAVYEQLRNMLNANDVAESGIKICDSSIKVVVQVLKLCGRHLETMKDGISDVDEILTKLNVFAKAHRGLSEPVKQQIKSLTALREGCWGMKDLDKYKAAESNASNLPSTSSSALICGPDGQPLSDEERAFLEENFGKLDSGPVDENDTGDEYEDFLANDDSQQFEEATKNAQKGLERLDINLNSGRNETNGKGDAPLLLK